MGSDGSPLTLDLIKLIQVTQILARFQPFSLPVAPSLKTQGPSPTHKHPLYTQLSVQLQPPFSVSAWGMQSSVCNYRSQLSRCLTGTYGRATNLRAPGAVFWTRLPLLYTNAIRVLPTFWGHSPCKLPRFQPCFLIISEYAVLIGHPKKKKKK